MMMMTIVEKDFKVQVHQTPEVDMINMRIIMIVMVMNMMMMMIMPTFAKGSGTSIVWS